MSQLHLGEFEELVLLAVWALDEEGYAVSIQQQIEDDANRPVTMGAVYAALDRLEDKGCVESWMGEPTQERGGRSKRFYRITGAGAEALYAMRRTRERMWDSIDLKPYLRGI